MATLDPIRPAGLYLPSSLDAGSIGVSLERWRGQFRWHPMHKTGQEFPRKQGGSIAKKSKLPKNNATIKQSGIALE
jgi:hypothetical protein